MVLNSVVIAVLSYKMLISAVVNLIISVSMQPINAK